MDELNQASQNNNVSPTPPLRSSGFPTSPTGYAGQSAGQAQTNIVPPSPSVPEAQVRTMASDIQSMSASGGEPMAQQIVPPPLRPSGFSGQEPIQPASVQLPINSAPAPMPQATEVKSGKALVWFGVLVIIVGIGWVSYKYGLPAYRAMMPNTPESAPAPAEPTAPQPPTQGFTAPAPAPTPAPTLTPLGKAQSSLPQITTDGTATSITAALMAEAKKTKMASGTIEEVTLASGGVPMTLSAVMNALLPEAKKNGLDGILTAGFDPVFSTYIFYDDRGAWPGYIAKINPAGQIDTPTLASRIQAIEASSYKNLFLVDPGAPATFRTGQARGQYIDRFVPLATDGALFSYGIFGDYLIINTTNNGLVKALDLLKL